MDRLELETKKRRDQMSLDEKDVSKIKSSGGIQSSEEKEVMPSERKIVDNRLSVIIPFV